MYNKIADHNVSSQYGMQWTKERCNWYKIRKYERRNLVDIQGVACNKIFKWMLGLSLNGSGYG